MLGGLDKKKEGQGPKEKKIGTKDKKIQTQIVKDKAKIKQVFTFLFN